MQEGMSSDQVASESKALQRSTGTEPDGCKCASQITCLTEFFSSTSTFLDVRRACLLAGVLWVSFLHFTNAWRAAHAVQLDTTVMTTLFTLYERYGVVPVVS